MVSSRVARVSCLLLLTLAWLSASTALAERHRHRHRHHGADAAAVPDDASAEATDDPALAGAVPPNPFDPDARATSEPTVPANPYASGIDGGVRVDARAAAVAAARPDVAAPDVVTAAATVDASALALVHHTAAADPEPEVPANPYDDPDGGRVRRPAPRPVLPLNPYPNTDSNERVYAGIRESEIIRALREAPVLTTREVGNTSVNLHCDLVGDIDGAYKPSEARHVEHWRAEIGAFRVGQLLGLERIPPAIFRRVARRDLPNADHLGIFFRDEVSRGAMIYWVPVLHRAGIFEGSALTHWTNLLSIGHDVPAAELERAEDISTLITFDFLIGNWDRWHGTNTLTDAAGRLVYRDNNGGFLDPMPAGRYRIIFTFLQRVQRFSRALIERARALTLADLQRAIAPEADGAAALLTDSQLRGVLARRDTLSRYVDALVAEHGADQVFAFP